MAQVQIGETITTTAANGHQMIYRVIDLFEDGSPKVSSWDAQHSDTCTCDTWEGEDRALPDW
jgi:hypothetical protein